VLISVTRPRIRDEITPWSATNSRTYENNETWNAAGHAIDQDLNSQSRAEKNSTGESWLEVDIYYTSCVKQILEYKLDGSRLREWNCTQSNCSSCKGDDCSSFSLTVGRGRASEFPPIHDCKFGLIVTLESKSGNIVNVTEIAITAHPSEKFYQQKIVLSFYIEFEHKVDRKNSEYLGNFE
jgi:hypothetical protein